MTLIEMRWLVVNHGDGGHPVLQYRTGRVDQENWHATMDAPPIIWYDWVDVPYVQES